MKKVKLIFAVLAAVSGISTAVALTPTTSSSSPEMVHNWINWNNELVLVNQTQAQAQNFCTSDFDICLRAQDNPLIYTVGYIIE
ncbi:MAG TPA: hypothetical protein VJ720_11675 [Chitinophaga sp.]|nr:hypothetical protein [Chitinophaga sp.]